MNYHKIYIIGIEGGGTSALACFYHQLGIAVSGSDQGDHFFNGILKKFGLKVFDGFDPANLPTDADLIVYSSAYTPDNNPELAAALQGEIPVKTYAEALAEVFNEKYGIAVCGSHGKTTTTAWLAFVLQKCGLDPSAIIGANCPQLQGSSLVGQSDYLVIEADEYQNKLRHYQAKIIVLQNIDYDHPDYFLSEAEYTQVFADFVSCLSSANLLIANGDDAQVMAVAKNCPSKILTYRLDQGAADYLITDIKLSDSGQQFTLKRESESEVYQIRLFGQHNVQNAAAVVVAAKSLGAAPETIKIALAEFAGTERRLQKLGEYRGVVILDDFAHHPTEIRATLQAVRQLYPDNKLVAVFHPHTFSRTKALFNEFLQCFTGVDELIVLDIYPSAREKGGQISSEDLVVKMQAAQSVFPVLYIPDITACVAYLRGKLNGGEVLLLLGAGDVYRIGRELLNN